MIDKRLTIPFKSSPVLLDRVLQKLQTKLMSLPWLDCAFGRAYRLVEHRPDGDKFVYPAIYIGNGDYISVNPNDNFGNFSWFDIYDPQTVETIVQSLPKITFKGAIVFWYNIETIYSDKSVLYTEEVKNEIISLLSTPGLLDSGRLQILQIYENFENIYKNFSIEKIYSNYMYSGQDIQSIDKQFFMFPYCGLRIEFNLSVQEQGGTSC